MILFDKKKLLLAENASSNLTEMFLAVGAINIFSSEDGVTITQVAKGASINKLCCIKNKFFGFTSSGKILSSKDGRNWTDHGDNEVLNSVSGLGAFYTLGNRIYFSGDYTNIPTLVSYNGLDWDVISDTSNYWIRYRPILYKNNFVAIDDRDGKSIHTSSDFVNWNNVGGVADLSSGENEFLQIICSDGDKVYVYTSTNKIYSSSDLVNWELVTQLTDKPFSPSVAMSNGKNIIFAGLDVYQYPVCCFSNNGVNWDAVYCYDGGSDPILFGGCCSKGFWISSEYSPVLFSEDGSSWEWVFNDNKIYNIVAGSVSL